jgi:hypothetical protein
MKTRLSLLLLCSTLFASFAGGEEYNGLVVHGSYKDLAVVVAAADNDWKLTTQDLHRIVKLRLLSNSIKPRALVKDDKHFLAVNFDAYGNAFALTVELIKATSSYVQNEKHLLGHVVRPYQGTYGWFGIYEDKKIVIDAINQTLDKFLIDYLESNLGK